jgi:hypothetical protein
MLDPATPPDEKAKIKHDLLTYCGYDTLGMVKIRDELLKRSGIQGEVERVAKADKPETLEKRDALNSLEKLLKPN